ncbi:low molecular weight protein arginine phosphatase [Sutcliffiella sp. NC1]|uniref:Low molecular weight phosphatase family protein n=2 Tax=Bacillaceae TaxID=186817 RepID=A0A223KWA5_9BACI|nr:MULTISPECIES: low molecular weight protein arginine phosphatase [Sutcliffiella]AST93759.1 low molecular weight phosphatase family protein [Sutcliffiella cohnii]MED4015912.1 low molecular weight protein arginine phosphatase [Sutcliffiella cohnii]WBL14951.1 low molecular weight protein arginine phosphatase [Sutcliffiella sp. NC1]
MKMNILFVCTGNTCRSPMAEAILYSKKLPGVEVKSAGIYANSGSAPSPQAQIVLEEQGIAFDHRSTALSEEHIEWATYILTMTNQHKQSITYQYPHAQGKTFSLKEFADEDGDIIDPFGGSVPLYEQTFKELKRLIEQIVEKKL